MMEPSHPSVFTQEKRNMSIKDLYINVHSSFIYNGQNPE